VLKQGTKTSFLILERIVGSTEQAVEYQKQL